MWNASSLDMYVIFTVICGSKEQRSRQRFRVRRSSAHTTANLWHALVPNSMGFLHQTLQFGHSQKNLQDGITFTKLLWMLVDASHTEPPAIFTRNPSFFFKAEQQSFWIFLAATPRNATSSLLDFSDHFPLTCSRRQVELLQKGGAKESASKASRFLSIQLGWWESVLSFIVIIIDPDTRVLSKETLISYQGFGQSSMKDRKG